MIRLAMLVLTLLTAGCATTANGIGAPRPDVLRDVQGYAIASCLVKQDQPYLRDQGDAWASAIVQRGYGDIGILTDLARQVAAEVAQENMFIVRDETIPGASKALPLVYCSEIIDQPAVRAAIQRAAIALKAAYPQ